MLETDPKGILGLHYSEANLVAYALSATNVLSLAKNLLQKHFVLIMLQNMFLSCDNAFFHVSIPL